jgi:very-short-patch-repair endonuclease
MPRPRYNPRLKALARELRKRSTLGEVLLWQQLMRRQRLGIDFHRQIPIDEFIVDFFAPELMLAVEIDGGTHDSKGPEDAERQRRLEALGVRFLRFEERVVRARLEGVVAEIDAWIRAHWGERE